MAGGSAGDGPYRGITGKRAEDRMPQNKTFRHGTKLRCTALRFVPRAMVGAPEAASRVKMNAKKRRP